MTDPTPETKEQVQEELDLLWRMRGYMEQAFLLDASDCYRRMAEAKSDYLFRLRHDSD